MLYGCSAKKRKMRVRTTTVPELTGTEYGTVWKNSTNLINIQLDGFIKNQTTLYKVKYRKYLIMEIKN